jgi:hypothetical protein
MCLTVSVILCPFVPFLLLSYQVMSRTILCCELSIISSLTLHYLTLKYLSSILHSPFRALCTRHIGDLLPLDPTRMYKDVYLKYLGWMCLDYSADVRKEAVRSIGKLLKVLYELCYRVVYVWCYCVVLVCAFLSSSSCRFLGAAY